MTWQNRWHRVLTDVSLRTDAASRSALFDELLVDIQRRARNGDLRMMSESRAHRIATDKTLRQESELELVEEMIEEILGPYDWLRFRA